MVGHGRGAPRPGLGVARSRRVRRFRIADPPQPVESLLGAGHNCASGTRRLRREKTPASVAAGARRAGVSRTCIYTNPDAKTTVSKAIRETADQSRTVLAEADDAREATWRERALNGEDALKATHIEIPHWRTPWPHPRPGSRMDTAGISPDTHDGTAATVRRSSRTTSARRSSTPMRWRIAISAPESTSTWRSRDGGRGGPAPPRVR